MITAEFGRSRLSAADAYETVSSSEEEEHVCSELAAGSAGGKRRVPLLRLIINDVLEQDMGLNVRTSTMNENSEVVRHLYSYVYLAREPVYRESRCLFWQSLRMAHSVGINLLALGNPDATCSHQTRHENHPSENRFFA